MTNRELIEILEKLPEEAKVLTESENGVFDLINHPTIDSDGDIIFTVLY